MNSRQKNQLRISPGEARRQGQITQLALLLLGRDRAIAFLNEDNAQVGGRPLAIATASEEGCAHIEAELARLTLK
jgi:hypothetical protein